MSAFADYRLLWNASIARRHPTSILVAKVSTALMIIGGAVVGLMLHQWMWALRIAVVIPLVIWLLIWTMLATPNLALMNTPANARLVPRMRRRMVELIASGWVLTAVVALLGSAGHAAPVIVLWVISMAGGRSGSRVASVMIILAAMSGSIVRQLPPQVVDALSTTPATIVLFVLVALYGLWTIRSVLPNGGDRHFDQRKRQIATIERLQSMGRKPAAADGKRTISAYGWVLRRAITARRQSSLMLLGLGPGAPWTSMLPFCAMILVAGVGGRLLFGIRLADDFAVAGWVFLLTLVVIVQGGFFGRWRRLVTDSRNEVALLRLAPRCPDGPHWNRSFGTALVRNGLAFGGLVTLTVVVLALLNGAGSFELISVAALSTVLIMPGIAWMLRDVSTEPAERALSVFGVVIRLAPAAIGVVAGLVAMLGLQMMIGWLAWVLLAVASNVVGALVAARWWQKMAAPAAFIA